MQQIFTILPAGRQVQADGGEVDAPAAGYLHNYGSGSARTLGDCRCPASAGCGALAHAPASAFSAHDSACVRVCTRVYLRKRCLRIYVCVGVAAVSLPLPRMCVCAAVHGDVRVTPHIVSYNSVRGHISRDHPTSRGN